MAALKLFPMSHSRYLVDSHVTQSVLLCQAALARARLLIVPDLVSCFLVLFSQVSLIQTLFVLNFHVDGIVHQTLVLHSYWQLLNLVEAMDLGFFVSLFLEFILFRFVVEIAVDWVKIVSFPVLECCLSLVDLIIG